jgi:hypothetical protein
MIGESAWVAVRLAVLQVQTSQQPIEQFIIQIQQVRDLVGFDEDRPRFRRIFVSQVLEVLGDRTEV